MASVSTAKRIKWGSVLLLVLVCTAGVVELLRRQSDREQERAIRRALVHARSTGGSPSDVAPDWDRLAESLRSRLRADPGGSLARLAHGAAARVALDVPRGVSLSDRPKIPVIYGDRPAGEVPVQDQSYFWIAELEARWNKGSWREFARGSWGPDGPSHDEIDLVSVLPCEDIPVPGWVTLHVRLFLRLYTDDNAIAAAGASNPEELERVAFLSQERRALGTYRVEIRTGDDASTSP